MLITIHLFSFSLRLVDNTGWFHKLAYHIFIPSYIRKIDQFDCIFVISYSLDTNCHCIIGKLIYINRRVGLAQWLACPQITR